MQKSYEKLQDMEGDWYWIPLSKVAEFNKDCEELEGMYYTAASEAFDDFDDKYSSYKTGGDPSLIPDAYK